MTPCPRIPAPLACSGGAILPRRPRRLRKLDPRKLARNPVIFVTEVVAALVTVSFVRDLVAARPIGFTLQIALWLWFTVLFANFAEASPRAAARPQADALRAQRVPTPRQAAGRCRTTQDHRSPRHDLERRRRGAGRGGRHVIPADGEVIEGVASVNEAAITGESAPVIREAGRRPLGRHRRHHRALRLDQGAHHRGARLDLPRPHDRAGRGRGAAEDPERDRARPSCWRA